MATYPVWIGNLKETVKEKDLMRVFGKNKYEGGIASCKVMRDENGQSKKFGYVNFHLEADAESAAVKMSGFKIESVPIKTKGPSALRESGHLTQNLDYRPFTDCLFYVQTGNCKKGEQCPYRHNDQSRASSAVCPRWLEKSCFNRDCLNRHPSGKDAPKEADTAPAEVQVSSGSTLLPCEGQCGDPVCEALFKSVGALRQHVNQSRVSQSGVLKVASKNSSESIHSESADESSEPSGRASDVEILTDSEPEENTNPSSPKDKWPEGDELGTTTGEGAGSHSGDDSAGDGTANGVYGDTSGGYSRNGGYGGGYGNGISGYGNGISGYGNGIGGYDNGVSGSRGAYDSGGDGVGDDDGVVGDGDAEIKEQEDEGEEELNEWEELTEGMEEAARTEYSRLESLTEEEPSFSDDPGIPVTPETPSPVHVHAPHFPRHHLEPVGVFWDIENCAVPPDKSAFALANKIRKMFFEGKREAEFLCVCDIGKERKEIMDDLNRAQVTLVHISAVAKNAADDKLRQSLRRFAHTYHPPCTVVLISGDVNFAPELKDLRHTHNITITLVHNRQASDALKVFANNLVLFDDLIKDLEPPSVQPQSSACTAIVSGLPAMNGGPKKGAERQKIVARLSRLCDNCGGKVINVNAAKRTAHILFRSVEAATKAEKRMTGEDVYGSKILVKVQHNDVNAQKKKKGFQPPPQQAIAAFGKQGPYGAQDGPLPIPYGAQGGPLPIPYGAQGGPLPIPYGAQGGPLPIPYGAQGGPLPIPFGAQHGHVPVPFGESGAQLLNPFVGPPKHSPPKHRPSHGDVYKGPPSFSPVPVRSRTVPQPLPPPIIPDQFIVKLVVKVQADHTVRQNPKVLDKFLHSVFLQACVQVDHLAFLWCSYSELNVLVKLLILQSATKQKDAVADFCTRGLLTLDMARGFGVVCCEAIQKTCQQRNLPWLAEVCSWGEDEERDKYTRSRVIELLLHQTDGYMNWSIFKATYSKQFGYPISELTIQTTCRDAIHLLGNASQNNQVIVLYELSPLIKVPTDAKTQQDIRNNLVGLLVSRPEKQIRLMKIVRAYMNKYRSLPVSKQGGQPLQNIIINTPNFVTKGKTPSSVLVVLKTAAGLQRSPLNSKPANIEDIDAEFKILLTDVGSNGALPYKSFQQAYQTYFHRSFTVSDFVDQPNAAMSDLLKLCKAVKLQDDCVVLALPPAEPPPNESAPELSPTNVANFKRDCIAVFGSSAIPCLTLVQFKEEYEKHFERQLKLMEYYGAKKLIQLFEAIPDTVKITGDKDAKRVQLLTDTKKDCELKIERLLCDLPTHRISLDTFVFEYTKRFGALDNSYYGHRKLLDLLEAMPETLRLVKDGIKWCVCLHPVRLFACEIRELLADCPDGLGINAVNPNYKIKFQRDFAVQNYGFSKLIAALEAIQDVIVIEGIGPSRKIKLKAVEPGTVASVAQNQVASIALQSQAVPTPQSVVTQPSQIETHIKPTTLLLVPQKVLQQSPAEPRLDAAERHRLCSETKRILFCHHEHAMTVNELLEYFVTWEDPASPSVDELYQCLKEESGKQQQTFLISSFPGSPRNNLIQLNLKECYNKLKQDLLHVFVCHPTADFSLHLNAVLKIYQACFGHALKPVVYASVDVPGVFGLPCVAAVMKLDQRNSLCTLTEAGVHIVLTSLLTEVIFTEGPAVKLCDLPVLYQRHFGVSLSLCGAPDLTSFMKLPAISKAFQVVDDGTVDLSPEARFAEQLRHLLTIHSGRLLLSELNDLLLKEFGVTLEQISKKPLHSIIFSACSHVARLAGRKWLVWASSSCSYPPRYSSKRMGSDDPVKQAAVTSSTMVVNAEAAEPLVDVNNIKVTESLVDVSTDIVPAEDYSSRSEVSVGPVSTMLEACNISESGDGVEGLGGVISRDTSQSAIKAETNELLGVDNVGTYTLELKEVADASSAAVDTSGGAVLGLDFGGMTKEQVIEIFDREKGNPALMPRFLEYFGELSSRELERVMPSSKEKPVPKSTRRKSNMAIRFLGVPPATTTVDKTVGSSSGEQKEPTEVKSESAIVPVLQEGGASGLQADATVVKDDKGQDLKSNGIPPSPGSQSQGPLEWPTL